MAIIYRFKAGSLQPTYNSGSTAAAAQDVDFAFSSRKAETGSLTFNQAFDLWIDTMTIRRPGYMTDVRYIAPKTEKEYRQMAKSLGKTFGTMKIETVNVGHLREYQRARAFADGPWKNRAGANLIRKEITMLIRILRSAGYWNEVEMSKTFRPVKMVDNDVPRAMTPDQQEHFLAVAASRERWHYIRNYAVAALQTTCSTNEMRQLRISDVLLEQGVVQIRREGRKIDIACGQSL